LTVPPCGRHVLKTSTRVPRLSTNCRNCGAEIADGSNFCNHCGLNLTQEYAVHATLAVPVPANNGAALARASGDAFQRLSVSLGERYAVERELGRGGMATVYLARDTKHDREVAIKVLLPELSASIGAERFEREIRMAAKLQHPHILSLYDSGEADGLLFYVMPFVRGESLRDRIEREGMLPIDDAIGITLEVADALGHAHDLGIVHRDIKPENILLQGGHALVADFGIARAVSEAGAQKLTQTGMAVGTPVYMAPEQSLGQSVGPTADLYSLGCVLYEMLAGEPPFTGKNAAQIMARHAMEAVPSIRIVRNTVPEEIEEAIFRVLAKVPADRPQNAAAFAESLGVMLGATASMRVLTGATATRRAIGSVPTSSGRRSQESLFALETRPPTPAWKRPRVLATALTTVAVAAGAWWFGPFHGPRVTVGGPDARRIAVLYFRDVSKDSSLGPLADGLTEGLIRTLNTSSSLTVISQNGVERFRASTASDDSIARALRAGYLVRGEVEPQGERVSVSVNLLDASGAPLSRAAFAMPAGNPLAMRDTLTVVVSDLVRQQIGSDLKLREQRGSTNSEAWLLLQRGVQRQKRGDVLHASGDAEGREREFAAADSLYAEAEKADHGWSEPAARQAALAYRRSRLAGNDAAAIRKWVEIGMGHANRALGIDANDADAWEVRGNLRYFPLVMSLEPDEARRRQELDSARADLERATTINTRQAGAYATLSHLYYQIPSLTETDVYLAAQSALNADEFLANANLILSRLFYASYDLGQFDRAQQWCDQARQRFPGFPRAESCRLYMLTAPGATPNIDEAWRLADTSVALYPPAARPAERLVHDMLVAAVIAKASRQRPALADSARHVAKRSEGTAELHKTRDPAFYGARVYTILGDKVEAVRLLKEYLAANPGKDQGFRENAGWWFREIETDPGFRRAVGATR
jgi:serine/threonine-protein kinase